MLAGEVFKSFDQQGEATFVSKARALFQSNAAGQWMRKSHQVQANPMGIADEINFDSGFADSCCDES